MTFQEFNDLKKANRAELLTLPRDEAQAAVEEILHPRHWQIENPEQLAWPGYLADDEEGD